MVSICFCYVSAMSLMDVSNSPCGFRLPCLVTPPQNVERMFSNYMAYPKYDDNFIALFAGDPPEISRSSLSSPAEIVAALHSILYEVQGAGLGAPLGRGFDGCDVLDCEEDGSSFLGWKYVIKGRDTTHPDLHVIAESDAWLYRRYSWRDPLEFFLRAYKKTSLEFDVEFIQPLTGLDISLYDQQVDFAVSMVFSMIHYQYTQCMYLMGVNMTLNEFACAREYRKGVPGRVLRGLSA